jgi:hypothetical protein
MPKQTDFDFGDEKIRPSDLRALAYVLVETSQMPTLENLLTVVADVRTKYKPLIEVAQKRQRKKR